MRRSLGWAVLLGTLTAAGAANPARAHPGSHERIDDATARIERDPTAESYLRRALLWLEHGEIEETESDIDAAERVGGGPSPDTRWLRVRAAFEAGRHAEVLERLDAERAEGRGPEEAEPPHAVVMRARTLARLGRRAEADAAFGRALDGLDPPPVDLYLEVAANRSELGRLDDAAETLERGLGDHPENVQLRVTAFELERDRGAWAATLEHVSALPEALQQSPQYLVERAKILRELGRADEARVAFEEARASFARYPERRRQSPAFVALEAEIDAALSPPPPPPDAEPTTRMPLLAGGAALLALAAIVVLLRRRRDRSTR